MKKVINRAPKAYNNVEFLNSSDARALRMLAEFVYPKSVLRRQRVTDTIVFFGSARTKSRPVALAELKALRKQYRAAGKELTREQSAAMEQAEMAVSMSKFYEDATTLAKLLGQWSKKLDPAGRFLICSGGGPGIMEAANKGARLAGTKTIGFNISIPFEQLPNQYISEDLNFEFHYFFMRKFWFVYPAKAFVMFPGGFGTLDEMMEVLTLLQTQKIKKKVSLVLYGRDYWNSIINLEEMIRRGVIGREDTKLFSFADTPHEAFSAITKGIKTNYYSSKEKRFRI